MRQITIDKGHQGPFGSANGGYVAGILADAAGGPSSATRLIRPIPIGKPLVLLADDGRAAISHEDQTLAETVQAPPTLSEAEFIPMDVAVTASDPEFDMGIFADCFVCGRSGPGSLGVRPKQLDDGRFVAIWRPASSGVIVDPLVPARYLRAALDCPGGFAASAASGKLAVTGSLASRIDFLPGANQHLIVVGEAGKAEGRKLHALTTIYTESEEVVATAESVWVALESRTNDAAA